jgi:cardiolipin synthase
VSVAAENSFARALRSPPNLVTLSRIGLIAVAVALFAAGRTQLALLPGVLAGATDYLDGWLARRTGRVTRLGEILDQFCDVALELVLLVMASTFAHGLPPVLLVPYVLREMWVAGIRRYAAEKRVNIPSRFTGKLKSAFLGWSAVPLFLGASLATSSPWAFWLVALGRVGVVVGLLLSVVSGVQYTRDFIRVYED